ncbi:Hypothetical predicted protein [Cloeon dipterum]|uniref:poly(ADP-ribose) glycohydrolase n=1 Tax=Cloeon dipterum TaxID=197152 RepID=A0A8S1E624_9INSE|nr:Hypothetical predicted protein [Cloeon dipterum]
MEISFCYGKSPLFSSKHYSALRPNYYKQENVVEKPDCRRYSKFYVVLPYTENALPKPWPLITENLASYKHFSLANLKQFFNMIGVAAVALPLINCLDIALAELEPKEADKFKTLTLQRMRDEVLELGTIIKEPFPLLCSTMAANCTSISLSRRQIFALMSCSFLGLIPTQEPNFPKFQLCCLLSEEDSKLAKVKKEKVKFLIAYFNNYIDASDSVHSEIVNYQVNSERVAPDWLNRREAICMPTFDDCKIEDNLYGAKISFANSMYGGGVLGAGSFQEELLILEYPESLVGLLLFERLASNSAALIYGAKRHSEYSGYGGTMKYEPLKDMEINDAVETKILIAIDASDYSSNGNQSQQYLKVDVNKELVKCYAGFRTDNCEAITISTGQWGCGVFKGDWHLKCCLQLMVASVCRRKLRFHMLQEQTYNDTMELCRLFEDNHISVGKLYKIILEYGLGQKNTSLFGYIRHKVEKSDAH